jgi:hypothetical protein
VRDVLAGARVNHGMSHFGSKRELVRAVMAGGIDPRNSRADFPS